MSWADRYVEDLQDGKAVKFRPFGNSMHPKVKHRQLCTVEPVEMGDLTVGDIVLCKVGGRQYLHLVKAVEQTRVQIGNNRGNINGWTRTVYGRLTTVED